jgi:hypothetical protein
MLPIEKHGHFSLTRCWRRFSCEIACLTMMDVAVSTPRSRWTLLLRAYQGALTKHLSTLFWYLCIMSILVFFSHPLVGHHIAILVAALVYIRGAYCTLAVRISIHAASTFFGIWFAVPLVSSWCVPSQSVEVLNLFGIQNYIVHKFFLW